MDYSPILQQINGNLNQIDNPISSLFSYIGHIWKALEVTVQYVSQLPDYFRVPVLTLIPIAILLFILGR